MNPLKSELLYSTTFRNTKVTNEGELADFAHLTLKLVAMVITPENLVQIPARSNSNAA